MAHEIWPCLYCRTCYEPPYPLPPPNCHPLPAMPSPILHLRPPPQWHEGTGLQLQRTDGSSLSQWLCLLRNIWQRGCGAGNGCHLKAAGLSWDKLLVVGPAVQPWLACDSSGSCPESGSFQTRGESRQILIVFYGLFNSKTKQNKFKEILQRLILII